MSTLGSLIVKISADIKDFTQGLDRTMKSTSDFGKFVKTSFDVGAKALTAMGTAATAVGVNATRMAMDFESSFAGVKKTIDGTEQDFANLSAGMRALAQEIPVNVNELNKIGETAGAMGIAKENVLEFTKVISMMGSTTNLTTDMAATAFGQMATLMNLTQADFQKLGLLHCGSREQRGIHGSKDCRYGAACGGRGQDGGPDDPRNPGPLRHDGERGH